MPRGATSAAAERTQSLTDSPLELSPTECEQRRHPRYLLTVPVILIPVLADGGPDTDHVVEGLSVDLSAGGMGLETKQFLPGTKTVVVGVETHDGDMSYCSARVRHAAPTAIGYRVGIQFYGPDHELLRPERLTPSLCPKSLTFAANLSDDALSRWGLLGVVRPVVVDWVQLCFQCQALLTFRKGCPHCGSARIASQRLIHHFACAHIGFAPDFEVDGALRCPKCRTKNLVIGTDFEFLDGPFRCLDCQWGGTELESIAQCLKCRVRFPAHRAMEKEIVGYHVRRLDPMAFLPAS